LETEITLKYPSTRFAKSVMQALTPDNTVKGDGMRITATTRGRTLKVAVKNCERIETLRLTVQDIFRCIRAAESSLGKTK